jgi:thiosulfate/3-mercaptopyruvate sulfurtransferase
MTTHRTLIPAADLIDLLARGKPPVLLDCGFDLADTAAGERAYREAHLPGALYANLDRDLSGPKTGRNGRHPLPDRADFAARAGRWGVAPGVQVVAYDAQGGPYAARAWWLLRWLGHDAVAVLDGGPAAFVAAGGRLDAAPAVAAALGPYPDAPGRAAAMPVVDADALAAALFGAAPARALVLDARALERFRGEVEPLDPVAGHIPGAAHRFFKDNLRPDGRFKPRAELRAAFEAIGRPPGEVVHQCGSGVTACHNLLAMEHAGLAGSSLYPGSWSEWCADPARPVARG